MNKGAQLALRHSVGVRTYLGKLVNLVLSGNVHDRGGRPGWSGSCNPWRPRSYRPRLRHRWTWLRKFTWL